MCGTLCPLFTAGSADGFHSPYCSGPHYPPGQCKNSPVEGGSFACTRIRLRRINLIRNAAMFLCVLIFILILPVTFLSLALEDFFSSDELDEMGVIYRGHSAA